MPAASSTSTCPDVVGHERHNPGRRRVRRDVGVGRPREPARHAARHLADRALPPPPVGAFAPRFHRCRVVRRRSPRGDGGRRRAAVRRRTVASRRWPPTPACSGTGRGRCPRECRVVVGTSTCRSALNYPESRQRRVSERSMKASAISAPPASPNHSSSARDEPKRSSRVGGGGGIVSRRSCCDASARSSRCAREPATRVSASCAWTMPAPVQGFGASLGALGGRHQPGHGLLGGVVGVARAQQRDDTAHLGGRPRGRHLQRSRTAARWR